MSDEGKSGKGCLFYGCLSMVLLSILGVGLVIGGVFWTRNKVASFLSEESVEIAVYEATAEEVDIADDKLARLRKAVEAGEGATISLTESDINTIIATDPELAELKGKVHITIVDNTIKASGSFPLSEIGDIGLVDFTGKYLNGDITLMVDSTNGKPGIYVSDVTANDKALGGEMLAEIKKMELLDEMRKNNDPQTRQAAAHFDNAIRNLEIRDGKLIIHTKDTSTEASPVEEVPVDQ